MTFDKSGQTARWCRGVGLCAAECVSRLTILPVRSRIGGSGRGTVTVDTVPDPTVDFGFQFLAFVLRRDPSMDQFE